MKKLLLIPSLAVLAFASCDFNRVQGDGNVVSKSFNQTGFKDIDASSAMNVILKQGTDYSVKIDAEKNLLELIEVRKEGDELVVGFKDNVNVGPTKDINVYITAPEFHKLGGSGACTFSNNDVITGNEIKLDLSGACNTHLNVDVKKLDIEASGASEIEVKGKAVYFAVDGSGSTSISAFQLISENADIELSGAGDAKVFASKSLKADLSGAGSVQYKGNPATVNKEISGAGSVSKAD
ncbi:MAG: head GIN domain-containing protein [Taibaiella sp.]|jgi:hypothetical protein